MSNPPSISGSKSVLYPDQITFSEKKSWTGVQKCLLFFAILFFIATAVFLALFLVYYFKYEDREKHNVPGKQPDKQSDICDSVNCARSAAVIADKMDPTVDPCEDFAKFACGNFYETAVINEGDASKNSFTVVNDQNRVVLKSILREESKPGELAYVTNMKNLYKSCMDEAKIEEVGVQPYLDTEYAKEWPTLIGQNWPGEATFNLNDVLAKYTKISIEPIFSYAVYADIKNNSRNTLYLIDPSLGLPREYLLRPLNDSVLEAYVIYRRDVAIELGADPTVAQQDAAAMLGLERELANITVPRELRRNTFEQYNPTTLAQLGQNYSYIDLPRALRAGFSIVDIELEDDQQVIVSFPSYYEKLHAVLENADKRALMNLFGFNTAFSRVAGLTKRLREIGLAWSKVISGRTEEQPRWKTCLSYTSSKFSTGISKQFTNKAFSDDSKTYMEGMIDDLKVSFREILHDATWMSDTTKAEAYAKLTKIGRKIGYPDQDFTEEYFSEFYQNLTMSTDNYYQNRRINAMFGLREILKKLPEPVDKSKWYMAPYEVNAYYSGLDNEVVFPAGILQPPFYWDQFPDSVNYGAIGVVIGHEITHGFDDTGSQYDSDGQLNDWWTKEDQDKFKEKRQCLVDQYAAFVDEPTGKNVNGINTQGENVADNGGLKESYRAYKKHVEKNGEQKRLPGLSYTQDQLFFLGYAQIWCEKETKQVTVQRLATGMHALGRFRIIGVVQNSPEFAKAYNCPVGSPMNPKKKCSVW